MIAEVIVDISNSEVDKIFDYSLGQWSLDCGYRVLVPFGRMTVEGYILGIKENSDYDKDKIKEIIKPLEDYPVITQEMIALMKFMTYKYHLRIVDVLRLFIPAEMRGGRIKELKKTVAYINEEYLDKPIEDFIKPSAHSQREVFNYLLANGEKDTALINKTYSASALRNLIARGIVLVKDVEKMRTPYSSISPKKDKKITLNKEQQQAVNCIINNDNKIFLLHGVTGSGKTEVYMHCIQKFLQDGKNAIMLVPEISLTPQVLANFRLRFGDNVAILHSGLSAGERFDEWRRILSGDSKVVVGARSAIFAPIKNLGLIIIDEEHDSSYVSESNPRYLTHEVAKFRQQYNGCNLVLGSATPSIDSYYLALKGDYQLLELTQRANNKPLPHIDVVNMCDEVYAGNNSYFSRLLVKELTECMEQDNQAIIFINRRGYSSFLRCNSCGYVAKCSDCDVSLVYHKEENVLKCHYCGNRYAVLDVCPVCKSPNIRQGFVGTQMIVEGLRKMFPDKKILRMDNDTTTNKDAHLKILSEFASKKASILVGTQMIAKGHDFPNVTLVGIIDADMSLHFSDYRSSERTYQLITQVAGRAGRDSKKGKVVLQTYSPHHYVYKYAVTNDYKNFYAKEANLREVTKYPPFAKIIRVLVTSVENELSLGVLKHIFDDISVLTKQEPGSFAYFSAMKSPVNRIQNKYRNQIIIRLVDNFDNLIQKVYNIVDKYSHPKVNCFVEINPNNLS